VRQIIKKAVHHTIAPITDAQHILHFPTNGHMPHLVNWGKQGYCELLSAGQYTCQPQLPCGQIGFSRDVAQRATTRNNSQLRHSRFPLMKAA
jgi:hypothetical protein